MPVIKQAHWLLLRNRANLDNQQRIRLADVLEADQALMTVYLMKVTFPKPMHHRPPI